MVVNGPRPVVLAMGWDSPVAVTSDPSPMPIAFVAPKPAPSMVTVFPGACAVGVNVMVEAALVSGTAAMTMDSVRKTKMILAHTFVVYCIFFTPLVL